MNMSRSSQAPDPMTTPPDTPTPPHPKAHGTLSPPGGSPSAANATHPRLPKDLPIGRDAPPGLIGRTPHAPRLPSLRARAPFGRRGCRVGVAVGARYRPRAQRVVRGSAHDPHAAVVDRGAHGGWFRRPPKRDGRKAPALTSTGPSTSAIRKHRVENTVERQDLPPQPRARPSPPTPSTAPATPSPTQTSCCANGRRRPTRVPRRGSARRHPARTPPGSCVEQAAGPSQQSPTVHQSTKETHVARTHHRPPARRALLAAIVGCSVGPPLVAPAIGNAEETNPQQLLLLRKPQCR